MSAERNDHEEPGQELPQELLADLWTAYGREPSVPDGFDLRVLARVQAHKRPSRLFRWRMVVPIATGAAAACLLLAGWLAAPVGRSRSSSGVPVALRGDLNGDHVVNVLDAFLLARRVERREPLETSWDFDGNGRVDRSDADRVAAMAVDLKRTPS